MTSIEKGWHNTYSLKYQIVWVTKDRYNKFFGQVEKDTKETLKQIALDYDWEIEEMEMMPDHVHLFQPK